MSYQNDWKYKGWKKPYQKIILSVFAVLLLGQSMLVTADGHIIFDNDHNQPHEEHHDEHVLFQANNVETESSASEQEHHHCCHVHTASLGLLPSSSNMHLDNRGILGNTYNNFYIAPVIDASLRPPIV